MKTRPWPIVLLAIFYLIGPLYNTWAGAKLLHTPYFQHLHSLFAHAPWRTAAELSLYPMAAIAIYAVKSWSYPSYLLIIAIDSYLKFQDWRHFSKLFTFPMFLASILLNALLVGYFLIPAVRAAYFNKRLRWWESKPRYQVNLSGVFETQESREQCSVLNISEGGALVKTHKSLELGSAIELDISVLEQHISAKSKVVHKLPNTELIYGLQFIHTDASERKMKQLVKALSLLGFQSRSLVPHWDESLKEWIVTLLKTGKGLTPEIPNLKTPGKSE